MTTAIGGHQSGIDAGAREWRRAEEDRPLGADIDFSAPPQRQRRRRRRRSPCGRSVGARRGSQAGIPLVVALARAHTRRFA